MKVRELIRNDVFNINCNAKIYRGDHNYDGELLYEEYNSDCNIEDVADMEISYITTDKSGLIIEV